MSRLPNPRRTKIHRSYTVEEVAHLYGVHRNTVRQWIKQGLPVCDDRRPLLILGRELAAFLTCKRARNKRPCKAGEIYCVRCRAPQSPALGMADYEPLTTTGGNLIGLCPKCGGMMYRRVNRARLSAVAVNLEVRFTRGLERNMLKDRPSVADHTVDKIGMLWRFAKEHLDMDGLGANPAREVAAIHTTRESHKAWPAELCAAFEALNSPRLVRAYYLLRYTGQRRSDVVKMRRDQFDGTAIEVVQEKTGTPCWIPCHATLREQLNRAEETSEFLLSNSWGRPYRATSITNMICKVCSDLGYAGYSPHGLRHLAGAALAESGCSVHEIMAILGHLTEREAYEYVRQAQRKVMARSAIDKWQTKDAAAAGGKNGV